MITSIVLLLFLFAPLPLVLIERVFPYPYLIEEVLKLILVWVLVQKENKNYQFYAILAGSLFFSISEHALHLANFIEMGAYTALAVRIIFTTAMHVATTTILYLGCKKSAGFTILGLLIAIVIHYCYNSFAILL